MGVMKEDLGMMEDDLGPIEDDFIPMELNKWRRGRRRRKISIREHQKGTFMLKSCTRVRITGHYCYFSSGAVQWWGEQTIQIPHVIIVIIVVQICFMFLSQPNQHVISK